MLLKHPRYPLQLANPIIIITLSKSAGWVIRGTIELSCYGFFAFFSALAAFFCACVFFGFFCSFPFIALLYESASWANISLAILLHLA
jgi:hypothetical protein